MYGVNTLIKSNYCLSLSDGKQWNFPRNLGRYFWNTRLRNVIWHSEDHASWYIPIIKPPRCTNFSNLFLE